MVHRTVVTLRPDGTHAVTAGFVHGGSTVKDASRGTARLTTRDPSCVGSSLWVYADPVVAAEICFQGTGIADLRQYNYLAWDDVHLRYVAVPWAGAVRSYYPGVDAGRFLDLTCTGSFCVEERFPAWGPQTTAGAIARSASGVCLGSSC
jgi:hypothetical protein